MGIVGLLCSGTLVLLTIIFIYGAIQTLNREKAEWNNGKCPECGKEWEFFDMDSQGYRVYKCENNHTCAVSYNVDKK